MKALIWFLTLTLGTTIHTTAQEKALAKIHYHYTHIHDTTRKEHPLKDELVTYLGSESAYFKTYTDELWKEQVHAFMRAPGEENYMKLNFLTTPFPEGYIINPHTQKILKIDHVSSLVDAYATEVTYESQDWTLMDDTLTIGGYRCQKAKTTFKGRNYTAWFTSDLPFPFGPWKLHGLPGLILSAQDDKGEIVFAYAGFDRLEDNNTLIALPHYVMKTTDEQVKKLKKAFEENPNAYLQHQAESGKMSMNDFITQGYKQPIYFSFGGKDEYNPSATTNNPLELQP